MSSERDPAGSEGAASDARDDPLVQPLEPGKRDQGTAPDARTGLGPAGGDSSTSAGQPSRRLDSHNMLPSRQRRRSRLERLLVRLIATCGIVGIGVAIAAIMVSSKSQGWVIGLAVSIVSVVLAAILWSSRQL
jgi:hypothetical protein